MISFEEKDILKHFSAGHLKKFAKRLNLKKSEIYVSDSLHRRVTFFICAIAMELQRRNEGVYFSFEVEKW